MKKTSKILSLVLAVLMIFELGAPAFAFDFPLSSYERESAGETLSDLRTSIVVNGVNLPTEEYPVGSYFTDSGKPCRDHRTGVCGYGSEDQCNCKAYYNGVCLRAVQCYGYANYLYYRCFGSLGYRHDSFKNVNLGTISAGNVTVENFKELIESCVPGSHLRVTYYKPDGVTISNHSLIIMDWNEEGFSACECNLDARCGVFVMRRSYEEYVPTLISVDFFSAPLKEIILSRIEDVFEIFRAFFARLNPFAWNKKQSFIIGNLIY